ncbi:unnamed protein product, partial [Effrenium voratum]
MAQVNASAVTVLLQLLSLTNTTNTSNGTGARRLSNFLDNAVEQVQYVVRRLAVLVVRVDYVIRLLVETESEAVTAATELLVAVSAPSDQDFSAIIAQAIEEVSEGNSSYTVEVTARQANVQIMLGDQAYDVPN